MEKINGKAVEFIKSSVTGGHYGFITERAGKVFTNKMKEAMLIELKPDDIVVDIGSYVGEFSMWASSQGVKKVISYEATPTTFKVLQMNKKDNMEINNLAVVGDDRKEITLFISTGVGVTNSIVKNKKDGIIVNAINYTEIVKEATVVKIDVEGAEYDYDIIQPSIRAITIEFHPITGVDWKQKAQDIMDNLKANNFKSLYIPTFSNGWDMNTTWIRN